MKRPKESNTHIKNADKHTKAKTLHLGGSCAVYNLDYCILNLMTKYLQIVDYEDTYITWNLTSPHPVE